MDSFDTLVDALKKDYVSPQSLDLKVKKVKIKNKDGDDDIMEIVKSSRYNLHQILLYHPKFDSLFWDDFGMCMRWEGAKFQDHHITRIAIWLERIYKMTLTESDIRKVLYLVARQREKNPLLEYLDSHITEETEALRGWDGVSRIETLLIDYFGVDDSKLHRAYSKKFFIGAIRRALFSTLERPVKMDVAIMAMGEQSIGKSSAVNALAMKEEWFSDEPLDITSKDYHYHIQGKLLFEMAEWANRSKSIQLEKAFFTKRVDRYRPVHKTFQLEVPRRTSFWINVNRKTQFNDSTGSRRFWAFTCGLNDDGSKWEPGRMIDYDTLRKIAPQVWLEARYLASLKDAQNNWVYIHWLNVKEEEDRITQNELYSSVHPWTHRVLKAIDLKADYNNRCQIITTNAIFQAMGFKAHEMNYKSKTIIEMILRQNKFDKTRTNYNGVREYAWSRPNG